jgi:hypothetical protein
VDGHRAVLGRLVCLDRHGPGFRTTASHWIHPGEPGSVVTLVLEQDGLIGQLIGRLTAGLTNRYLTMEGNGLRDRAEQPPSQAP